MRVDLDDAIKILSCTPSALDAWLRGLPEAWIQADEGGESWSAFDIVGHFIHGEKTGWIPRLEIILRDGKSSPFESFDRFAQTRDSRGKSLGDLLDEFAILRGESLERLRELELGSQHFELTGRHPELGTVTLSQLLATWVAHDLAHIRQIARVMAKQYAGEVGPWGQYLPVMRE